MNFKSGLLIGMCAFLAVVALAAPTSARPAPTRDIDWRTSPLDLDLRGMNGARYTFYCPPGKPEPSFVAGSGPYTDASSICTAAAHAGAIRAQSGGSVTIEIRPGQSSGYPGSEHNYIKTNTYDRAWSGSFVVIPQPASATVQPVASTAGRTSAN